MSSSSTENTQKHPKKRKFVLHSDDDDDDGDLLYGSPAFGPKTSSTTDPAMKSPEERLPRRRSPRRSSISTLDGATSSPSLTIQSSPANSNATFPSDNLVIIDEHNESLPPLQMKKKLKKNRPLNNDINDVVSTEHEQASPFTLTKVTNSGPHESSANETKDSKSSQAIKRKKNSRASSEHATANPVATQSSADQTGTGTKGGTVPARVSMSNEKKPRESSKNRTTPASVLMSSDLAVERHAASENVEKPRNVEKPKKTKTKKCDTTSTTTKSKENTANTSQTAQVKKSKKVANATTSESTTNPQTIMLARNTTTGEKVATKTEATKTASSAARKSPTKANPPETVLQSTGTENNGTAATVDGKLKKKKKKKLSPQDSVFQHLFLAMRPFNTKDLLIQLKNVSETELNFIMLSLIDKGLVAKKEFTSSKGRSKTLYWAVDGVVCKEVAATQTASLTERNSAKQKYQSMQMELMSLQKTMAEIQSDLSNDEINRRLKEEEQTWKDLQQKVAEIRARIQAPPSKPKLGVTSKAPPRAPASPDNLKRRINHMRDEWKGRKAKVHDFVEQLSDAMEKKPKEVYKLLDLETDEMCGVTLPPKYEIEEPVAKKKRY